MKVILTHELGRGPRRHSGKIHSPRLGSCLSKGCEERAVNIAILRDDCDVAVIGAGPYGLAVAAHLRAAKVTTRVFGDPMAPWRAHMRGGIRLRTRWRASHIADPNRRFTLDAYAVQ